LFFGEAGFIHFVYIWENFWFYRLKIQNKRAATGGE